VREDYFYQPAVSVVGPSAGCGCGVLYLLPEGTLWAAGGCQVQSGSLACIHVVTGQVYDYLMFTGGLLALISASPQGSYWCVPDRCLNSNCSCRMEHLVVVRVPGGGVCSIEAVCCCLVHGDDERTILLCCIKSIRRLLCCKGLVFLIFLCWHGFHRAVMLLFARRPGAAMLATVSHSVGSSAWSSVCVGAGAVERQGEMACHCPRCLISRGDITCRGYIGSEVG